jgi:hypothetical protein
MNKWKIGFLAGIFLLTGILIPAFSAPEDRYYISPEEMWKAIKAKVNAEAMKTINQNIKDLKKANDKWGVIGDQYLSALKTADTLSKFVNLTLLIVGTQSDETIKPLKVLGGILQFGNKVPFMSLYTASLNTAITKILDLKAKIVSLESILGLLSHNHPNLVNPDYGPCLEPIFVSNISLPPNIIEESEVYLSIYLAKTLEKNKENLAKCANFTNGLKQLDELFAKSGSALKTNLPKACEWFQNNRDVLWDAGFTLPDWFFPEDWKTDPGRREDTIVKQHYRLEYRLIGPRPYTLPCQLVVLDFLLKNRHALYQIAFPGYKF